MKPFKVLLLSATFFHPAVHVFAGWDSGDSLPRIEIEYRVILSSAMENCLKAYDPDFKVWDVRNFSKALQGLYEYRSFHPWKSFLSRQSPAAVIGDFNGDEIPDVALMGRNKTHGLRIVLLSGASGYSVVEFTESYPLINPLIPDRKIGSGIEDYLEFVPPMKIKAEPSYNRPALDLKKDAFKFGVFERGSSIHIHIDNKRFVHYPLSD